MLRVAYLGRVSYQKGLEIQQKVTERLIESSKRNQPHEHTLLLLEHPATYTVGRRTKGTLETEGRRLNALGADYYETLRGGQITFHGPGQLVGYPIVNLKSLDMGVRAFVCKLEQVLIDICKYYDIQASRTNDTGVWIDNQRKIAAIGIHVSQYVTSHGFALNCNTDLNWFKHIVPCGIVDKDVTSITREQNEFLKRVGTETTVSQVLPIAIREFQRVYNLQVERVDARKYL